MSNATAIIQAFDIVIHDVHAISCTGHFYHTDNDETLLRWRKEGEQQSDSDDGDDSSQLVDANDLDEDEQLIERSD